MHVGVLFADVRGFTSLSESMEPRELSALLRRLYSLAEQVIFPEALIDKLVGDQVMALYVPAFGRMADPIATMLHHACSLLLGVGYGSGRSPMLDLGVGLDFGRAFVGNIGDRSVSDFTAVGDVVNTASRLQGEALGGEIVLSERVARGLRSTPGRRLRIELKGKREPVVAYRASVETFL